MVKQLVLLNLAKGVRVGISKGGLKKRGLGKKKPLIAPKEVFEEACGLHYWWNLVSNQGFTHWA